MDIFESFFLISSYLAIVFRLLTSLFKEYEMKKRFFTVFILTILFCSFSNSAFSTDHPEKDIVDTAVAAGNFKTLVAAVKAAGLVDVLKGDGPFTVFAPSDEAFAKLPAGTVEALLKDKVKLTSILTYHVVPGRLMASDVLAASTLKTVQGQALKVTTAGGAKVDAANIVATDIETSNGVIHVIDSVVLPN